MTLILRPAARSDRGLIRDGNQDSVYAGPRLLAVADGMGGMAAGDVASNIVIAAMAPLDEDVPGDNLIDVLRSAVNNANQQLRDTVEANPHLEGMGTTLTAMLFAGTKLALVHIGDSRAYQLRDGEFTQLTKDDTYVQMLVDEGRISPEEASSHPQRSLLTRAMDGRDVEPDYSIRQVLTGDRYLICSDGLSGVVSAETIGQAMREYADPQECVERLIALALRGGGPDNVTVIVADATDENIVEMAPVVGGAAARDRGTLDTPKPESTPAARASALTGSPRPAAPPAPASAEADESGRLKRHPVRTALLVLVLLVLLGGGLWYAWDYSQSRYYIGATTEGDVAIFRGVPGQIAGFDLSEVSELSSVRLDDLTAVAQDKVRRGIHAESRQDARARLDELIKEDPGNANLLPPCPVTSAAPAPTAGGSGSVAPTPTSPIPSAAPSSAEPAVVPSPAPCRTNPN